MSKYDLLPCTHRTHKSVKDCTYAHERLALEARIVRHLIRSLKAAGWKPFAVWTGDKEFVRNETETMDAVFSVDEAAVVFRSADSARKHSVMIVLGNGIDCITDWGFDPAGLDNFDATMDKITDEISERYG